MICCVPSETVGAMSIEFYFRRETFYLCILVTAQNTIRSSSRCLHTRHKCQHTAFRSSLPHHCLSFPSPCVSLFPNQCGMSLIVTRKAGRAAFFGL